jgi:hypothetical protein
MLKTATGGLDRQVVGLNIAGGFFKGGLNEP